MFLLRDMERNKRRMLTSTGKKWKPIRNLEKSGVRKIKLERNWRKEFQKEFERNGKEK